jgi:hypothetical protein
VAAAKLDSILVSFGWQLDVPLLMVSDDKIFQQASNTAPDRPEGGTSWNSSSQEISNGSQLEFKGSNQY